MKSRLTAVVVFALALATPGLAPTATAATAAGDVEGPHLDWAQCPNDPLRAQGFECARMDVPLDRRDPSAGTISLALVRHRATGSADERIGSLLFDVGGPGGPNVASIVGIWPGVPDEVRQRFDLVGFDPRGVGESTPLVDCESPMPKRPATGPVDWADVVRSYAKRLGRANRSCQQRNERIASHMGTNEVVADLDRVRQALGEEQLSFWGMSYGTRIGYVYALQHPDRVRALVLDGPVDPAATTGSLVESAAGPDQAYASFADVYPAADRKLRQLLTLLEQQTVRLPQGQVLTRWHVIDHVFSIIAHQLRYPEIAASIDVWHTAVFGSGAEQRQAALQTAASVKTDPAMANDDAGAAFSIVNCLDYADRPTLTQAIAATRGQHRLAPIFGGTKATAYSVGCAGLTLDPDPVPDITGRGPELPVLILDSSRDGATVVQWSARMSRAFPHSRSVTYAGGQHVTWAFAESACVNAIANDYVLTLHLPAVDQGCSNAMTPQPEGTTGQATTS